MIDSAIIISIVGILATVVGALIWIIKYLFTAFMPVMDRLVTATELNTQATRSADEYLRQRNGRDNEFHNEVIQKLTKISTEITQTAATTAKVLAKNSTTQEVREQTVEHQIIQNKE